MGRFSLAPTAAAAATPLVALAAATVLAAGGASAAAWPAAADADVAEVAEVGELAELAPAPATAGVTAVAERPPAPVAVAIATVAVSTELIPLGLHPDRTLQVPDDPDVAGWYTGAARPGETGPVVVVGHVDSRSGPGVFARLRELMPGEQVELVLADGETAVYRVTGSRQVAKDAFPTQEVYGAVPGDELRLITCGGAFDRTQRSYLDNIVVNAVRV